MSSAHEQSVSEFLRFARFKRGQCVKTVEAAFQHLADSRLVEDTFTCERGEGKEEKERGREKEGEERGRDGKEENNLTPLYSGVLLVSNGG